LSRKIIGWHAGGRQAKDPPTALEIVPQVYEDLGLTLVDDENVALIPDPNHLRIQGPSGSELPGYSAADLLDIVAAACIVERREVRSVVDALRAVTVALPTPEHKGTACAMDQPSLQTPRLRMLHYCTLQV
jgi:hypothetical protein